jgi:type I restriction enzyme, S subunit
LSEWRKVRLGDYVEKIGSGATPRGGQEVYQESGIALIRSQNIYNNYFSLDGLAYINDDQAKKLSNVTVESGDVLLNITGDSVARACQVPDWILPARVNQHVAIIRPDKNFLDARFVRYVLVSPQMQTYMLTLAGSGATRKALTKGMIENFQIPAFPLPEQRAIAEILGSLDDKIEANRRQNETLEATARAIFKSWFVDFDPVHYKARGEHPPGMDAETAALFPDSFEESELGLIPSGWGVGTLGDIAANPRRSVQPEAMPMDTLYVGLEHIPRQSLALPEWGTIEGINSNKYQFDRGDILFGKLRPYFHKVVFAPIEGICSTDILVVISQDEAFYGFSLMHLSSEPVVEYATRVSTGTRMPRANWDNLSRYPVVVPSYDLLEIFNTFALPMFEQIQRNVHESRTLAETRDALLPRLVSGEVRVGELEDIP